MFSTEFKRATVQRILTGEKTLAEPSRDLAISPSVIRNSKRFAEAGATTAVQASEVPASHLREAYAGIRELDGAWAQDHGSRDLARGPADRKKMGMGRRPTRAVTRYSMSAICTALGMARRTACYIARPRPGGRYHRADDATVLQQIRADAEQPSDLWLPPRLAMV